MTALDEVAALVRDAPPRLGRVRLVAVDGPSGSGKTTVADALLAALTSAGVRAAVVRTDHFATWEDPFGWWPRLELEVLTPVAAGRPASFLAMDWTDGTPVPRLPVTVPAVDVLVLEGVSSGRRAVAGRLSSTIWVEHPDRAVRTARAVARDGDAIREPLRHWQAAEEAWFAVDGTRDRADVRWTYD